jgi:hypothetical protein
MERCYEQTFDHASRSTVRAFGVTISGPGRPLPVIFIPLLVVSWFLVAWYGGVFTAR